MNVYRVGSVLTVLWALGLTAFGCRPGLPEVTAQVELTAPWVLDSLKAAPDLSLLEVKGRSAVVRLSERQFVALSQRGYEVALVVRLHDSPPIPSWYPRAGEVEARLTQLAAAFPHLAVIHRIGRSGRGQYPIWALKVSDHPIEREDEPTALFYGGLHAQEALGVVACLELAEELCRRYGAESTVTDIVDSVEIWLVPLLNPEGYELVLSGRIGFPWWRKNLQDNNVSEAFEPEYDGVDLNRNFGFNWDQGGSDDPSSWYYRGPQPFSEAETAVLESLAVAQRFVVGLCFHSHGRKVLYPWSNAPEPPDGKLLRRMAQELARCMRPCGGRYGLLPLNAGCGQSSVWLHGAMGTLDFTMELGTEYFPEQEAAHKEVRCAIGASIQLLEHLHGPGVRGRVSDAHTGRALHARVSIAGLESEAVWPRMTDPATGRFYRLLEPGTYQLQVGAKGYRPVRRHVRVGQRELVDVVVELEPEGGA